MSGYFNEARSKRVYEQNLSYAADGGIPKAIAKKLKSPLYQNLRREEIEKYVDEVLQTAKSDDEIKERIVAFAARNMEKEALELESSILTPRDAHSLEKKYKPRRDEDFSVPALFTLISENSKTDNSLNNRELYDLLNSMIDRRVDDKGKVFYHPLSSKDIKNKLSPDILEKLKDTLQKNPYLRLNHDLDVKFDGKDATIFKFLAEVSEKISNDPIAKGYFFEKADVAHQICAHTNGPTLDNAIRMKNEILAETLKSVNDGSIKLAKPLTVEDIQTLLLPKNKIIDPYLRDLKSFSPALNEKLSKCVEQLTTTGAILAPLKFGDAYVTLYAAKTGSTHALVNKDAIVEKKPFMNRPTAKFILNNALSINDAVDRQLADGKCVNVDKAFKDNMVYLMIRSTATAGYDKYLKEELEHKVLRNTRNLIKMGETYKEHKTFVVEHGKLKVEALTPDGTDKRKAKFKASDFDRLADGVLGNKKDATGEIKSFITEDLPFLLQSKKEIFPTKELVETVKAMHEGRKPALFEAVKKHFGSMDTFADHLATEYTKMLHHRGFVKTMTVPYANEGVTLYDYEPHVSNTAIEGYLQWKQKTETKIWLDSLPENSPAAVNFNFITKLSASGRSAKIADSDSVTIDFTKPSTIAEAVTEASEAIPYLRDFIGDKKMYEGGNKRGNIVLDLNDRLNFDSFVNKLPDLYEKLEPYINVFLDNSYNDVDDLYSAMNLFKRSKLSLQSLYDKQGEYSDEVLKKAALVLGTTYSIASAASISNKALEKIAEPLLISSDSSTVHKTEAMLSDRKLHNAICYPMYNEDIFDKGKLDTLTIPVLTSKLAAFVDKEGRGFKEQAKERLSADELAFLNKRTYSGQQMRSKVENLANKNYGRRFKLEQDLRNSVYNGEISSSVSKKAYVPSLTAEEVNNKFYDVSVAKNIPTPEVEKSASVKTEAKKSLKHKDTEIEL